MVDEEQNAEEQRCLCPGCWAELGPGDAFCPLCRGPRPEQTSVRQAGPESTPELSETAGVSIGAVENDLRRQALILVVACALVLTIVVAWLELQVNAFRSMKAEFGLPSGPGRNGVPTLADFAGRWQVIEGPGAKGQDYFEFVMRNGELILPLGRSRAFAFKLEAGWLRGSVEAEGMRVDLIAVPTDGMREMGIWLYPSKGRAVKLRATRVWGK